ncbi:MAG TPA: alpha/beta hydrolase [Candidatus Baltobacteraceae bacterium]|nr:alpha/beta hydrolase [Candidatus Baltobacteraceae bacterium]
MTQPRRRFPTRVAALPIAMALVAGCGSPATTSSPLPSAIAASPSAAAAPTPSPAPLSWTDCGAPFECATLSVPLDYAAAVTGTVHLSLIRLPATDRAQRLGSLVTNPGGPGESGVDFVRQDATTIFPAAIRERFDIVGFDPRGVGLSTPVRCGADMEAYLSVDPDPVTTAQWTALEAADKTFATACGANAGPLLSDVSTLYAARDMDLLRAALGAAKLTYVGYSYGTFLGATYAGLFPDRVRALVLDAAVDPALDLVGRLRGQAASFEGALDRFLASCSADSHCDFYEGGASARAFDRLIAGLDRKPLPAPLVGGGRAATAGEAWSAILGALYSPGFGWPYLARALGLAAQGDGSLLLATADALNGRKPDGEYSNAVEANTAIDCVDEPAPTDPAAYVTLAQQLVRTAPRVGRVLAASGLTCAFWPVRSRAVPGPIAAAGAPPIVVIGGTGDPATPYAWSVALAKELDSGVLLTRTGEGHGSYGLGTPCIDAPVDAYLLDLTAPANGTVCK